MVKFFSTTHIHDHPWASITQALWQKYPNPYSPHVLSADVLSRSIDEGGALRTTRLLTKKGKPPKWGVFLLKSLTGYILEISEVDPFSRRMEVTTMNISYSKIASVVTKELLRPHPADPEKRTLYENNVYICSNSPLRPLRTRIESFCMKALEKNIMTSYQGLAHVANQIDSRKLSTSRV